MEQSPFPDWLDEILVPDESFAAAYDSIDDVRRAELKLAVARLAACFGELPAGSETMTRSMRQGFQLHENRRCADFAVIVWDENIAGPTRLLAALMPAILAGVPRILACRARNNSQKRAFPAALLTALELAGQELTADCAPEQIHDLVRHLGNACRRGLTGRMVVLGHADFAADMSRLALDASIPVRPLAHPVRIGIDGAGLPREYADAPHGMLAFAQPDAEIAPAGEAGRARPHAVLCAPDAVPAWLSRCPLVLTPGHESCWLWPDLSPDFFLDHSFALLL